MSELTKFTETIDALRSVQDFKESFVDRELRELEIRINEKIEKVEKDINNRIDKLEKHLMWFVGIGLSLVTLVIKFL